jgi:hypothetical protein
MAKCFVLSTPSDTRRALRQLDADEGALQCRASAGNVCRLDEAAFENVLCFAASSLGTFHIDLGREVRGFRHNHHSVRPDLQEAAEDGELLLLSPGLQPKHTGAEK